MSIRRAVAAVLGVAALATTTALLSVTPAAAAPADAKVGGRAAGEIGVAAAPCYGWRTLVHGQTGLNAVVEPGAPWHVRLASGGNGYQNFMFCDAGTSVDGTRKVAFWSNANKYLTANISTGEVTATGENPDGFDYWFVCYLDSVWVEIRFTDAGRYLGPDSSGYLVASDMTPNGNILWFRNQFSGLSLNPC